MAKKEKKAKKGKAASNSSDKFVVLDAEAHKVRINNVRLSFPALFAPKAMANDPNSTPKYSAAFLLDDEEHRETIDALQEIASGLAESIGMKKLPVSKSCLKPGSEKDELEGFENCHFISASNSRRPLVLDTDKSPLVEADGKLYPGCYVNAVIQLWAQDNKWGKRVNASLDGVQFHADGESLGGGTVAEEDDFE